MKTIYQSPKVYILEIQASDHILLNTSDTKISGENGGWVKEDPLNPSKPHYDVWDDDWRDDEEKNNEQW